MKNLKRAVRRAICVLLTAAMLCADTGVTVYAAEGAEQKVSEGTVEETQAEYPSVDDGQTEGTSTGEVQTEDGQVEEPSTVNDQAEETVTEEGETGKPSSEETPVKEETADENSGGEKTETDVTEEKPAAEDGTTEENSDVEAVENIGDVSADESVSENDIEDAAEILETAERSSEGDSEEESKEESKEIIASGTYEDITWVIDAEGKLTVEGTGNFAPDTGSTFVSDRSPWYKYKDDITSAVVNVTGMTDASYMFFSCGKLTSVDTGKFDTSEVTDMSNMFSYCYKLTSVDVSGFNTEKVTDMGSMFWQCSSLENLDVSGFETDKVTDMSFMFGVCKKLTNLDVSRFNTRKVTDMNRMFLECESLTSLDVSGFDTGNVTDMSIMFSGCKGLTALDVSGFDTSNVTDMESMFSYCNNLTSLDVRGFATGKVTKMNRMFSECRNLKSLDVDGFDTGNVTNMESMFGFCTSLESLDLSGFATGNVTNMSNMFNYCSSLTSLDLSGMDVSKISLPDRMFFYCYQLTIIRTPINLTQSIALPRIAGEKWYRIDEKNPIEYFPTELPYSILLRKNEKPTNTPAIRATKTKVNYVCNEEINLDDLTVIYNDGATSETVTGYTTNANEIDMSTPGIKELKIIHGDLTATVRIYVRSNSGSFEEITWEIDADGKLTVTGQGEFSVDTGYNRAPWYNERESIKSAVVNVTGMTDASYMFSGCGNLTGLDMGGSVSSSVTSMEGMFSGCSSLENLDVGKFDTSEVTSMARMFSGCSSLESLVLSGFDTSNVTDMKYMFYKCSGLTALDVDGMFSTSKVADMKYMFQECKSLKSLDVGKFDTREVTSMLRMFSDCSSLESLDLRSFHTGKVKNMGYMFWGCSNLTSLELTVDKFETGNVTNMGSMFASCYNLADLDVSKFETGNVTDMSYMFSQCRGLTSLNVSGFHTGKVISANSMFEGCSGLQSLEVGNFDTSNITNMGSMFSWCRNLTSLDVSKFETGKVTTMFGMFSDCESLTSLDVGNFNTSNVTDSFGLDRMFHGCSSLTSLDVGSFDTSNVTSLVRMFSECSSLESLDLSNFKTGNVTDMGHMFYKCSGLTSLDLSGFDTGKVTDMEEMFGQCSNLTSLDVGSFDTGEVTNMTSIFDGCGSLTSLDLSGWDVSKVSKIGNSDSVFHWCSSLAAIDTPLNLTQLITLPGGSAWYQIDGTEITELPQNLDHSIVIRKNEIPITSTITVTKNKITYLCGDTVNVDDITVTYYDADGRRKVVTEGYSTNVDEIDTSTPGTKILEIEYWGLTATVELNVKAKEGGEDPVPDPIPDPTPDPAPEKTPLSDANVTITLSDTYNYVYDGKAKSPEVTVVYKAGGKSVNDNSVTLKKDSDYTVTYENNINAFEDITKPETAQTAPKVIITGKNKYSGTVRKAFAINKAAAPAGEEQIVSIQDCSTAREGRTVDLSGCFADYGGKTGYSVGTTVEDDTIVASVLSGKPSVDEKGLLTYGTNAGEAGDFAVIPIVISFSNYKDTVLNVKIIFEDRSVAVPVASPESGRQVVAGSKVTLTCDTAGAAIYYTTGSSEKGLADPTEKSIRYTEPIVINGDIYIKVVAIKGDIRSRTVTLHYTVAGAADKVLKPYTVPGQGTVEKGTKIELKSDTPDAVIYYVTGKNADMLGAVPVDDDHKYTEPIEVIGDMVIKAIAIKDGMEASGFATFVYKVKVLLDPPAAEPASGSVGRGSYISLKTDNGVNIYYTMDQSNPTTSGSAKLYESRIRVDGDPGSTMVIKTAAEKNGVYSKVATLTYTVSENTVKGLQVMLAGSEEFTYTGSAITPAVIVTNNGEELTEGEDYTVRYSNNVKVADKNASKAPKITVTGKGNLAKSRSITFSILQKDIGDEDEVVGGKIVIVKGKSASPVLYYSGVKLTAKDFVIQNGKKKYDNNDTIKITGKGNFKGTRDIDVKVVEKLKKFTVVIDNQALKANPLIYDGEAKTLDGYFKVYDTADKNKATPLEEYSDYAIIYPKNITNAGKVKFTIVGLGEYCGTVTRTYTIQPKAVKTETDSMKVSMKADYPYKNGGVVIPDLSVTCGDNVLVSGKDYKVTYSNNKKICTDNRAKCTISFMGNYKGSKALVRNFNINPANMNDAQMNGSVSVAVGDMVYTGKPSAYKSIPYVTVNGVLLKSADYTVSYYKDSAGTQVIDGKTASSSVNLTDSDRQTVYVKIEGKGNYTGILTAEYNVYRLTEDVINLAKAKVSFVGGNKAEYTGKGARPEIEVMYKSGKDWKKVDANDIGTYVRVTYINNVNKGKATVMINGSGGKYVGSKTAVFSITPKSIK